MSLPGLPASTSFHVVRENATFTHDNPKKQHFVRGKACFTHGISESSGIIIDNCYLCSRMALHHSIERLFRAEYRPLCLYALHYLDSLDIAEDVVSGCFETLWEKASSGALISNMRAYLYTSVRNASIDYLRKHSSSDPLPRDLDGVISDEEACERSAVEARMWTEIDRMPARRREVLLMAKRDGMSYAQIASSLGISENTVRNTLEAALKQLRTRRSEILNYVLMF